MSRTREKSSLTDAHARRIARAIAQGRPPPCGADLDWYCESFPREMFAAVAGAARHMPPTGKDEALAIGYVFVLQRLLEHQRYRVDRGYADAVELIAGFQAEIVARAEAGDFDHRLLALVGAALHQSKIQASPELAAVSAKLSVEEAGGELDPTDICAAVAGIREACGKDPFAAVGSLLEAGHTMPAENRCALASALALAGVPEVRSAAVLLLLDPDPTVREAVAGSLGDIATSLAPTDLRRLIAMRNWRPENERMKVDAVIRKARAAGIDCAQWPPGGVEKILATCVDGSSAQGFLLLSPAGRKKRLSSVLTKGGIADAWSGEPEAARRIEATLADAGTNAAALRVSRAYLDRMVAHHLALGTLKGEAPPFGLLQIAETIGGADWQPARMTFTDALAELIAEVPKAMREPGAVTSILRKSDELADLEVIAESWFEDDPEAARALGSVRGRGPKLATYLLRTVIARRRDVWAEIILRTALWLREAPAEADPCWRDLAIVAKALADGRDLTEIGLMHDIALRTIATLA